MKRWAVCICLLWPLLLFSQSYSWKGVESASPIREITVYDLSGRVMMTVECGVAVVETCCSASPQQQYTLNVSSLHSGIYLMKAVTDSGVQTARFVKIER